jgi:hypothetical protein
MSNAACPFNRCVQNSRLLYCTEFEFGRPKKASFVLDVLVDTSSRHVTYHDSQTASCSKVPYVGFYWVMTYFFLFCLALQDTSRNITRHHNMGTCFIWRASLNMLQAFIFHGSSLFVGSDGWERRSHG